MFINFIFLFIILFIIVNKNKYKKIKYRYRPIKTFPKNKNILIKKNRKQGKDLIK
jgi:hypothetical protein